MSGLTALVTGASGLVGQSLLGQLLDDSSYTVIKSLGRSPTGISHPKLVEIIVDLDSMIDVKEELKADHVYCCLGTTMKKAGSKEAFRKVDFVFPFNLAKISKSLGASHYTFVTASGANRNSIFFYNRIKAEVEEEITGLGYQHLVIVRPGIILGNRQERRIAEDLVKPIVSGLSFMFIGPLRKYKANHADSIARCMIILTRTTGERVRVAGPSEINSYS